MHTRHVARLALLAGCLLSPYAMAIEPTAGTTALLVDTEKFTWTEFSATNNNVTTWEDDGPRIGVGMAWSNLRTPSGGPVYRGVARLYAGSVDSDDLNPPANSTETRYLGVQAEGLGGYRLGGRVGVELVSGIGLDVWQRNPLDATVGATTVSYDRELWAVLNAKLGVGLFTRFDNFGLALRAGPKMPLVSWQRIYVEDGVDLQPKGKLSWFGQAEFTFGTTGKDNVSLVFYYDSYKWDASRFKDTTLGGVVTGTINQPETEMSAIGARLAIGF